MRLKRVQERSLLCVGVLCACLLACHQLRLSTTLSRQLHHQQQLHATLDEHAQTLARLPAKHHGLQAELDELRRSLRSLEQRVRTNAVSPLSKTVPEKTVPEKTVPATVRTVHTKTATVRAMPRASPPALASPVAGRQTANTKSVPRASSLVVLVLVDGHADLKQTVAALEPALSQAPGVGLYATSGGQDEGTIQMNGREVILLRGVQSVSALDRATDDGRCSPGRLNAQQAC